MNLCRRYEEHSWGLWRPYDGGEEFIRFCRVCDGCHRAFWPDLPLIAKVRLFFSALLTPVK